MTVDPQEMIELTAVFNEALHVRIESLHVLIQSALRDGRQEALESSLRFVDDSLDELGGAVTMMTANLLVV